MKQEFKKYYQNQEVTPPEEVWHNIEHELDQKKRRYPLGYLSILAIVIAGSTIGGVLWYQSDDAAVITTSDKELAPDKECINCQELSENKVPGVLRDMESMEEVNQDHSQSKERMENEPNSNLNNVSRIPKENFIANSPIVQKRIESDNINNNQDTESITSQNTAINKEKNEINTLTEKPVQPKEDNHKTRFPEITEAQTPTEVNENESEIVAQKELEKTPGLENFKDSIEIENKKNEERWKLRRWQVNTNFAPSYTRSASDRDIWLIDLAEYNGSYQKSNNYGVNLAYKINPKWSIRSGVEITNMRQSAKDVIVAPQSIFSTDANGSQINKFESMEIVNANDAYLADIFQNELKVASVEQHIQYLSVPMEFGLSLYDSKTLSINTFLGTTTHFLRRNSITLETQDQKYNYGQANNLRELVFGTQAGIQTQFKLNPNFSFIVEPKFLYYFNTFKDDSQVRPYTINLNVGLQYNFNFLRNKKIKPLK